MVFSWICRRHGKPVSIHRVQPSYRAGQDAGAADGRRVGRGARAGGLNAITQAGWCPVAASRRLPGRPGRRAQLRLLHPAPGRLVAEDGAGRRGRPAGRGGRLCLARAGVHALGRAQELVRLRDGALPQHRLRRLKSTLGGASAPANPSRSRPRTARSPLPPQRKRRPERARV